MLRLILALAMFVVGCSNTFVDQTPADASCDGEVDCGDGDDGE